MSSRSGLAGKSIVVNARAGCCCEIEALKRNAKHGDDCSLFVASYLSDNFREPQNCKRIDVKKVIAFWKHIRKGKLNTSIGYTFCQTTSVAHFKSVNDENLWTIEHHLAYVLYPVGLISKNVKNLERERKEFRKSLFKNPDIIYMNSTYDTLLLLARISSNLLSLGVSFSSFRFCRFASRLANCLLSMISSSCSNRDCVQRGPTSKK